MTDRLTPMQREVVRLYRAGWQASEIAAAKGIQPSAVYQHACNARRRGAAVPRSPTGSPPRKVDYWEYARLARRGLGVTAIARQCGVRDSTVSRALKTLREAGAILPAPPAGGAPAGGRAP